MAETTASIDGILTVAVIAAIKDLYQKDVEPEVIVFQQTRKEFDGDRTVVVFPLLKLSGKGPEPTAEELGKYLEKKIEIVAGYNVVKGFLNISLTEDYWLNWLLKATPAILTNSAVTGDFLVEYSSPNTNKPLHLGHIRNNLLGHSVSRILAATGKRVSKVQIINDRGIHICKSMVAWKRFGEGQTPASTGKKGDHLVGDFYVRFDQEYKKEIAGLLSAGKTQEEAEQNAPIMLEAREMLRKWEKDDAETCKLWKTMNGWVYEGFEETYKELGVDFDRFYYESETYLTGKETVERGLSEGIFYQKEDGSIWVDLSDEGLDHKLLIRSDGTSVYMTQDIGTAMKRQQDFPDLKKVIYTVGDEQNYHFKVLFLILKKLGFQWAENCEHLSYGMVELPSGKMKSREGTVVDADDLLEEMFKTARRKADELGKLDGIAEADRKELFRTIGLGALKFFILRVDPKKQIVFNPEESIDFNGHTGPFIQYTHARIRTLISKGSLKEFSYSPVGVQLHHLERELIKQLYLCSSVISESASQSNPALIANYVYDLVKTYNQYYQTVPILKEEDANVLGFRLFLSSSVADVIRECMYLLGIDVPNRM